MSNNDFIAPSRWGTVSNLQLANGINVILARQKVERLLLSSFYNRLEKIMATLDDLVAAAAEEDTKLDSLIALVVALKAKVDAIPGITPEQQAKIDAAFASITDNPQRIQDAIDANTPAEPVP